MKDEFGEHDVDMYMWLNSRCLDPAEFMFWWQVYCELTDWDVL